MSFVLPTALLTPEDTTAVDLLQRYYGTGPYAGAEFAGAWFDEWDSTGTRKDDSDRFTADDLVAVTFLSVDVPPRAARQLLVLQAARFNELLRRVGPDRDLAAETAALDESWPAWELNTALRQVDGLGPTTVSKLMARKRPRLIPIYDTVIHAVMNLQDGQ